MTDSKCHDSKAPGLYEAWRVIFGEDRHKAVLLRRNLRVYLV